MRRPRAKRIITAVMFCAVSLGFILALAIVLMSGGGSGAATAAPARTNLTVPLPSPAIGSFGAVASGGGMPAVNAFAARQLPRAMHVHATLSSELGRKAPQPRLVVSFPSFSGGYVSTPVFIPASEAGVTDDSSSVTAGPIILLGSAAGWSYLALSGRFDSDKTLPGIGNPQGSPPGTQTDPVVPGSNPGDSSPPDNNPPGTPPGNNPPGNNPPGSNPPGNNNPGNPPGNNPGNNPPGNNPPGNPPGNDPGNPGGNNPPGHDPGNPPGSDPVNNPGNPPGDNTPDSGNPQIVPVTDVSGDDLPVTTTPEPVSLVLLGSGLAAVAAVRNRRRKK